MWSQKQSLCIEANAGPLDLQINRGSKQNKWNGRSNFERDRQRSEDIQDFRLTKLPMALRNTRRSEVMFTGCKTADYQEECEKVTDKHQQEPRGIFNYRPRGKWY
jgi:hypothetical protein